MVLAWTGDELSRGHAQNGVNFDFEVKFDHESQGQSSPKTIGILTKDFYTYGTNPLILAWTSVELSRGQTLVTDGLMDGRTMQATTIPEGQDWPRVKMQEWLICVAQMLQTPFRWIENEFAEFCKDIRLPNKAPDVW